MTKLEKARAKPSRPDTLGDKRKSRYKVLISSWLTLVILFAGIAAAFAAIPALRSEAAAPITSASVPDGVYLLRNIASGYYMDVQSNSTSAGAYIQQYNYGSDSSAASDASARYKIERIGSTMRYLIRPMRNEANIVVAVGAEIKTKAYGGTKENAPEADTWTITYDSNGYALKPYNVTTAIAVKNTTSSGAGAGANSRLELQSASGAGNRAKWLLIPHVLFAIDFDSGIYMFQNARSGDYMRPNGTGAGRELESDEWDDLKNDFSDIRDRAGWRISHYADGYYTIKNEGTGMYLKSPSSGTTVTVNTFTGAPNEYYLWKFTKQSDGMYKVQSKFCVQNYPGYYLSEYDSSPTLVDPDIIESTTTTNRGRWNVKPLTMNLEVKYDWGYILRYGILSYQARLQAAFEGNSVTGKSVASVMLAEFGIHVKVTYGGLKMTVADECGAAYDQPCADRSGLGCYLSHHKNADQMYQALMPVDTTFTASKFTVFITGHKLCRASVHPGSPVAGMVLGFELSPLALILADGGDDHDFIIDTVFHEIGHLFGTPDDYKTDFPPHADGTPNERDVCIWGKKDNGDPAYIYIQNEFRICSHCKGIIDNSKWKLIKHS